jgi:hypothetical protein
MRISRTTLSDWFHRGHTTVGPMSVHHAPVRLDVATQLARKVPGFIQWFAGSRQSTGRPPSSISAPEVRGLSSAGVTRHQRSYYPVRLPPAPSPCGTSRPLPSCQTGLPQLPASPFRHAVPTTPMDQNGCVCRLLPRPLGPSPFLRRVGVHHFTFEACSGFTRVTAYRIAQPPKAAFVTRLRSRRLPIQTARQLPGPTDNFLGGSFLHW